MLDFAEPDGGGHGHGGYVIPDGAGEVNIMMIVPLKNDDSSIENEDSSIEK